MLLSKTPSTTCEHTWHYDSYCQWIEVAVHSEVKKISQGKYLQMNASNFVATISYSVFFTFFFSSVFHPQGVRKKNILIWCCIKFPEFSKNTLWWKPARAVTVSPGKREDFFLLVGYDQQCVCGWIQVVLWLPLWLSVTAHDLGCDNMWVSRESISLSAGWDTHADLVPEKQNYCVLLKLCSFQGTRRFRFRFMEWNWNSAKTISQSSSRLTQN